MWQDIDLVTADDRTLRGFIFKHQSATGIAVLHGATGVPTSYYKPFCEWYSSETKRHILIYEYRDTGRISIEDIKASKTTMADWGIRDQSAALDYVVANFGNLEIHTIGHSLGGFCMPFHENADKVASHTGINSGLAYWPTHPWHFMPQIILFWFVLGPLVTKILGYLPGILLGMKTNLPRGVYWQWRRWCTNPKLHEIDWGRETPVPDLTRFTGKLQIFATSDDGMIPPSRVFILDRFFPKATVEKHLLNPSDFGLKTIGHIQIFAERNRRVWPTLIKS